MASLNSPMEELGVRPLSVAENSIADVYEGEGLLNKSMGTPGINNPCCSMNKIL